MTALEGHRDGATYDPAEDFKRLNRQMRAVALVLWDGNWHTLADISRATGHPEASISARIRDLRKPKFGGHIVTTKRLPGGNGLHIYRWEGRK
jgi:hypothetical protein